jgi:dephospho-CoA kinase
MIKIGLTGGIGTGKTYLSTHFRDMGIPVYYADDEAKKLYRQPAFLKEMRQAFPDNRLWLADGTLNMFELSQSFEDEAFLQRLSRFVHPFVMRDFERWAAEQKAPAVMMESAILFEYGLDHYFDKIIVADQAHTDAEPAIDGGGDSAADVAPNVAGGEMLQSGFGGVYGGDVCGRAE